MRNLKRYKGAGSRLYDFNKNRLDGCPTGQARISPGFDLPSKYVISTAGPIYHECKDEDEAEALLRSCYDSCLKVAEEETNNVECVKGVGVDSIAFCGISTGIYGFPLKDATHVAIDTVRKYLENSPSLKEAKIKYIIFVCFPDKDYACYKTLLPRYFPPAPEQVESKSEL